MKRPLSHISLLIILVGLLAACRSAHNVLPTIVIEQADSIPYTRQWHEANLLQATDTLTMQLKGRGHSTFRQPKHPYAMRLAKKQPLCGMPAHRHWVLLANFFDHSLMRNALAMEVARQTSLSEVTPHGRFVSLKYNDQWQGIYWLSERVKDKISKTDSLLKLDAYSSEKRRKQGTSVVDMPRDLPIDTLSFVDWWLIHELCMNAEPNGPRSCYVRIVSSDTLKAGPVWDFDMAFNEVGVDDGGDLRPEKFKQAKVLPAFLKNKQIRWLTTDSLYCTNSIMLERLINDPRFYALSRNRWHELRPRFRRLDGYIAHCANLLKAQAERDQQLWNK